MDEEQEKTVETKNMYILKCVFKIIQYLEIEIFVIWVT